MNTLITKVQALLAALTGETVIKADQNAPRASMPYWTFRLSTQAKLGIDSKSQGVDANGIQQIYGVREITLQLQRYGTDSFLKCNDLKDNLSKQTERDKWQLQKIAVFNIGNVLDISFKLDNLQFEPRAGLDLFIRVGINLTDNVGVIETVSTTSEFDENANLTEVITVVL